MGTHEMTGKTTQYGRSGMRRSKLSPQCASRAIGYNGSAWVEGASLREHPAGCKRIAKQPAQHAATSRMQRSTDVRGASTKRCGTVPTMAAARKWSEWVDAKCGAVDAAGATRSGQQHVLPSGMSSTPANKVERTTPDRTKQPAVQRRTHTNEEGERGNGRSPTTLRRASLDVVRDQRSPSAYDSNDKNSHEVTQYPRER